MSIPCRVLFSEEQIKAKVRELAAQINEKYRGQTVVCLCILKGASIFYADLVRELDCDAQFDFMAVSSYGASTKTTGSVQIIKDMTADILDKHVLIIEDILDTGLTLHYIRDILLKRRPASIEICCLLDKPSRRRADINADYTGFVIEDRFVVGYGLDYAEHYRNLKDVCELDMA